MAKYSFAAVTNIPSDFHTADLRAHFSSLVESKSFICFHYRHRPEKDKPGGNTSHKTSKKCCVVQILNTHVRTLQQHNGVHWNNVRGDILGERCTVSLIQLKSDHGPESTDCVDEDTLLAMPELRPPELMPNGNVGTPTAVFQDYIKKCLLPQSLISKLHLQFPKAQAKRLYAQMDFNYGTSKEDTEDPDQPVSPQADTTNSIGKPLPHAQSRTRFKSTKESKSSVRRTSANTDGSQNPLSDALNREVENGDNFCATLKGNAKESEINNISVSNHHNSSLGNKDAVNPEKSSQENKSSNSETSTASSDTSTASSDTSNSKASDEFVVPPSRCAPNASSKPNKRERKRKEREERRATQKLMDEGIEERLIGVERKYLNDDDAEEWDRHEASEDDPSNQERNKERLYEVEIEQVWEKGGPGVIFYTDAVFWQKQEGDFDEQTTDDLDVDFSAYEEPGAGDKDIKDFLKIKRETRFRSGYDKTDRFSIGIGKRVNQKPTVKRTDTQSDGETVDSNSSRKSRIGKFERYSKGIGRKVMESQGWKEGEGLGKSKPGIVEALKGVGQKPHCKRGLGFVQEPPVTYGSAALLGQRKRSKREEPHLITTKFDHPDVVDPKMSVLQRSELSALKHRQSHRDGFSS